MSGGEIDLALVSRDKATRGTLLFQEPLVWVGSPQFEVWRRDPLPIAVYEATSLARRAVIAALSAQRRAYRVVYNSSSLAGQLAAVESGLALAVLAGAVLVLITCMLRRLHDMSRGVGTLLMLLLGSFMLPYMLLVLFFWPSDPLPNRYGPPGGKAASTQGLQARLRRLNGVRD